MPHKPDNGVLSTLAGKELSRGCARLNEHHKLVIIHDWFLPGQAAQGEPRLELSTIHNTAQRLLAPLSAVPGLVLRSPQGEEFRS